LDDGAGVKFGDTFSVYAHLLSWQRFEARFDDGPGQAQFAVPYARPALRGNILFPSIKYFAQAELAGTPRLLDLELNFNPIPEINIKIGQFVTPFTRQFLTPPMFLAFPEFAPSNVFFRDDRQTGLELSGKLFGGRLEYYGAVTNGNGIDKPNDNAKLALIGRLAWNLFPTSAAYRESPLFYDKKPNLSIGFNASYNDLERTKSSIDPATNKVATENLGSVPVRNIGVDLAAHGGPVALQSEFYAGWNRDAALADYTSVGGYAQVTAFVWPKRVQLGARGDILDPDTRTHAGLTRQLAGLAALYLYGDHLKLQARYAYTDARAQSTYAPAGKSHSLIVQTQLFF